MKRYAASVARERMADILDEAERHGAVLIERGDVQYVLTAKRRRARAHRSAIETIDPAIAEGRWQWRWTAAGLRFSRRRS